MNLELCPLRYCYGTAKCYPTATDGPVWIICPTCGKFFVAARDFTPGFFAAIPLNLARLRSYIHDYSLYHSNNHAPICAPVLKALQEVSNRKTSAASMAPPISQVGFFHFVEKHHAPMEELTKALQREAEALSGGLTLIVLPEAFNIGKNYRIPGEANTDSEIIDRLMRVAKQFSVIFAAGLIVGDEGTAPAQNSCYLISAEGFLLLCRKQQTDGNVNTPYALCADGADEANGVTIGGLYIFGTICMDVDLHLRALEFKAAAFVLGLPTLECIPANMGKGASRPLEGFACSPISRVVANSDPDGIGSLISIPGRDSMTETGNVNALKIDSLTTD